MSNTLTNLIPVMYAALDIVAAEPLGFIPAVEIDAKASQAAVGQIVTTPVTPAASTGDIVAGQLPPDDGDQNIGNTTMTIQKSKYSPIRWSGEELKGFEQSGTYKDVLAQQLAQSFRALRNLVETDLAGLAVSASRATGTAGTTPFATDLSDPANLRKILQDNGAPLSDLQLVINTAAGAKLRTLGQLTKANEAGTTSMRESGILLDIHGFKIRESAKVGSIAAGTGAGYLVNNVAGYAIGATAIAVDTGAGTVKAGNVVTFAGDTNKYIAAADLAGGVLTLAAPGLLQAVADNAAITVGATFTGNMGFERAAIKLLTRTPAMPEEGDDADDVYNLTDPFSGLTFQIAKYKLYRRIKYEVGLAWGVKALKSEFIADLLG
ncbi:P22 phage major capsid protein family protein [Mesoterricola silvestris]|uniref:P22 coat-protein 5 family protein n=1 Tax=Mesoterricola silvestris TaxID=2927979 RepID=A0AA48H5T7_9BACT|nr:P22 phage major capsid protein family protein [Mesoterricola silvestris]BDU72393.1 hypothetical protein METEAL_15670 [Mesoterricola silvestris]